MNKYEIYNEINDSLDRAVNDLESEDIDWLINSVCSDLTELKEQ